MPAFDFNDILPYPPSAKENELALASFSSLAFPTIAHQEITAILRQNQQHWQDIAVHTGEPNDRFPYPATILKQANRKRENILTLVLTGSSQSAGFYQELKAYADDFMVTEAASLADRLVIYLLFFVKQ